MGACLASLLCSFPLEEPSSAASLEARHEALAAQHQRQATQDRRFVPLLVLGLPGAGKSLLICQLASSFASPPHLLSGAAADDAAAAAAMRDATIDTARALAHSALASGAALGTPGAAAAAALLAALPQGCALTAAVAEAAARLWGGGGAALALAWDAVASADNVNYLVRRAKAQSVRGFVPSEEDRLRLHLPTLYPMRTLLRERWDKDVLHVVELPGRTALEGGGRQLPTAFALLRHSALGLVFCAALTDFDRVLPPHAGVAAAAAQLGPPQPPRNLLLCALDVWEAVAASPHFRHSHITLLLTKLDAFKAKLQTTDLRHPGSDSVPPRFLDYRSGTDASAALAYLEARFHERAAGRALPVRIQAIDLLDAKRVAALCAALKDHARHIKEEEQMRLDAVA